MIDFEKDQSMTLDEARQTITNALPVIESFLFCYVSDVGMMIQALEVSINSFNGCEFSAEKLDDLLIKARTDVRAGAHNDGEVFSAAYNAAVLAAPSVDFLVRHFQTLSAERPEVMPSECIPSTEVVRAALLLFHDSQRNKGPILYLQR